MNRDVVLVPSTPALLPEYAGLEDPVPGVRAACAEALSWLVARHPEAVRVLAAPLRPEEAARGVTVPAGVRIARRLLTDAGFTGSVHEEAAGVVAVANGTARRSEKAPGHLDERAGGFDASVERALRAGDAAALRAVDPALAEELWVRDWPVWLTLADLVEGCPMELVHVGDPYGVQYWVGRATCRC